MGNDPQITIYRSKTPVNPVLTPGASITEKGK